MIAIHVSPRPRLHHNANPALLALGKAVLRDQDATILAVS